MEALTAGPGGAEAGRSAGAKKSAGARGGSGGGGASSSGKAVASSPDSKAAPSRFCSAFFVQWKEWSRSGTTINKHGFASLR